MWLFVSGELVLLSPIFTVNISFGLLKSVISNIDIFNPSLTTPVSVEFGFVSYPNPIKWFSSYGCKYVLYPGIFSSPNILGFLTLLKSITNNGSISLNVTT